MARNSSLQAIRHEQGWSVPWTAMRLGCSLCLYKCWESGQRIPTLYWLLTLCTHFERSPEALGFPRARLSYPLQDPWHCPRREGLVQARIDARELVYEVAQVVNVLPRVYLCWELGLLVPQSDQLEVLCQHFTCEPDELGFASSIAPSGRKR